MHAGGPRQQADLLVQRDELGERRDREALVAVHDRLARHVAEHVGVRRGAVDEAERDSGVGGMQQRPLAFDEEHLAASIDSFEHELLGSAGDEVRDDRVDRDPPPRDRDPGLPRRDELTAHPAAPGFAVELEGDRHLPDRAVGADCEDRRRTVREVAAGRDVQSLRRLAEVAQLDAVLAREPGELDVVRDELVQAVLDVEAGPDRLLEQSAPRRWEATALRGDADERGRRLVRRGVGNRADDGKPLLGLPRSRRVENRRRRPRGGSG